MFSVQEFKLEILKAHITTNIKNQIKTKLNPWFLFFSKLLK